MKPHSSVPGASSNALPTFFRALCGESLGSAGHELTRHVAQLLDLEGDRLDSALAELDDAINPRAGGRRLPPDDDAVLAWFEHMLPSCMELVAGPDRRSFLQGVYRYAGEGENGVRSY